MRFTLLLNSCLCSGWTKYRTLTLTSPRILLSAAYRDLTLDKHEPVDFSNWIYFRALKGTNGWEPLLKEHCFLGTTQAVEFKTDENLFSRFGIATYKIEQELPSRK